MTFVTFGAFCVRYDKTMTRQEALRRVLFLKGVENNVLAAIAGEGYEQHLEPGETLWGENERCRGLMVVLRGGVRVCKYDARGRQLVLGVARPGTSIGDLALFDGGNYPYSAEAADGGATVYVVERARWSSLAARYPQIAVGAVRALAVEQRRLLEMLKAQTLHTVRARIAAYLLTASEEAGATNTPLSFALSETNAAIGGRVGTVREVVSRTLHALEDVGAICLRGRTVTVVDAEALRRLAQSG